ncbi:MAG TPA: DUF2625 domain-containing protein [Tepidisphaeraceae bacterium]|jgi:hypothetical protein|nr:DUF2625 domain-containing protein [Tepidisphaeraceae bacterium]
MPRPLSELINTAEPAWPLVKQWVAEAKNGVEVLPPAQNAAEVLHQMQVTTRSPMGAIIYETGGLLVDHGWIRILGSGHPRLPRSIVSWNLGRAFQKVGDPAGFLLIADDVIGGFYAIDGGALGPKPGDVFYFAPDTLRWESLDRNYSNFLQFCFNGDLNGYNATFRWPGWIDEISDLPGDRGIGIYPFPFTAEGKDITKCSRKHIPLSELYGLYVEEFPRQLGS